MKNWLLVALLLCCFFRSSANVDSLYAELNIAQDDSARSEINRQIAQFFSNQHNYQLAAMHLERSLELLDPVADSDIYAPRLISLSGLFIRSGLHQEAYEAAMHASEISKGDAKQIMRGQALLNAAVALKEMDQDSLSLETFAHALQIFSAGNDSLLMAYAYNGMGTVYKKLEEYPEALKYFKLSMELKKNSGAFTDVINTFGNIGNVLVKQGNYDSALMVFNKVTDMARKSGDSYHEAATLLNIASLHIEENRSDESLLTIDSALAIARQYKYFDLARELYEKLADIYVSKNQYKKAFAYLKDAKVMKDSMAEIRAEARINDLSQVYRMENMQHELDSFRAQTSDRYRLLYMIILVLLLSVAVYSYVRSIKLRKARNAYRASERKFRMLAENANEVVWSMDLKLNLTYISPSTESLFGYPRDQRTKIQLKEIVTEQSYELLNQKLEEKIAEFKKTHRIGEPVTVEVKGRHRDGHEVWVEVLANLSLNENGELKGVQGVSRNISARKNAELKMLDLIESLRVQDEELRIQNEQLQLARNEVERRARQYYDLFENGPVGYLILDAEAGIRELNSAAVKLLGSTKEKLLQQNFAEFIVNEHKKLFDREFRQTHELQKICDAELKIGDAHCKMVLAPEPGEPESLVRIALVDTTAEKLTRDQLSEALQLMNAVFDAIPGGINVVDKDHNVIILNSRLQKINKVKKKSDAIGKKCHQVYRCSDKPCETCSLGKVLETQKTVVRQTGEDEELFTGTPHRIYSSPMFNNQGEVTGMVEAVMDISDLVKVEEALRESEKKFGELFNEIPDAIFITRIGKERSGEIVAVNPAAEKQTGYSRQELVGMNILHDIVKLGKPDAALTQKREIELLNNKKFELVEQKFRKDGSRVWTEVLIQKISFNGQDMALSVSRDITDRKKAEESLRLSETKIRSLINTLPDLLFIFDGEGHFVDYHANDPEQLLVKPEMFMNRSVAEVLPDYLAQLTMKHIKLALETGRMQVFEYSLKTLRGVAYHESRMLKSRENEVLTVVREITEQKKIELELRKSEEKYRTIFANSPVGIFNFDENGVILDCNQNFVDIIGSSRGVLIGFNILERVPDQKLVSAIRDAISTGHGYYEDYYKSVTANKVTPVKAFLQAMRDDRGEFVYGVGIVEDITEQKKYEDQLLSAKKKAEESDKLKSSFMAIMSHELRTPLNSIIGFSEMLENEMPADQVEELSGLITRSGKHLLAIIENIFDISLIDSGDVKIAIENISLQDLMNNMRVISRKASEQLKKQDIDISVRMPDHINEVKVCTDIQKVKKIFTHLIHNALKFTRAGSVEIGIKDENVSGRSDNILFYVKDTGIGIEKEKHQLVFQLFRQADETSTREFEGTGLGLSIAKKLIELLGGEIWLDSTPGEGSTFYFELPCFRSTQEAVEFLYKKSGTEIRSRDSKTIVIAEDDDSNFQLFELLLKRKKMNVIRAYNGREAVEHVQRMPDINLVLMDINMPVMNGYQATREIKKLRKNLPVIAVTAYAMAGDEYKANEAGCDDYLTKPINNKLFYQTVYKHIS